MTTKVWTFYICDRCGKKVEYKGDHPIESLPDGWTVVTYSFTEGEEFKRDICPKCNKIINVVLKGFKPPEPKKPRKIRSDKGVSKKRDADPIIEEYR